MAMPVLKELALAGLALVLFLFVSNAFPGPDENGRIKVAMIGGSPWIGADLVPAERWLAKDSIATAGPSMVANPDDRRFAKEVSPGARVRKAFARFASGESRRAI